MESFNDYELPLGCVERRFLRGADYAPRLSAQGVVHAGHSQTVRGYRVQLGDCVEHLALYTLEGAGLLESPKASWSLRPDTVMLVPATTPVRFGNAAATWEFVWFYLTPGPRWTGFEELGCQLRPTTAGANLKSALLRVLDEHTFPSMNFELGRRITDLASDLCVTELELSLNPANEIWQDAWHARLDALWFKVGRNLGATWSVGSMAREVNLSYSTFLRYHLRYYGDNPKQRLSALRMKTAQTLLRSGNLPVKAVATMAGFRHAFAFSNAYRARFGHAPSQERGKGAGS